MKFLPKLFLTMIMLPSLAKGNLYEYKIGTKTYEFNNKNGRIHCNGTIAYPELLIQEQKENQELIISINHKIEDIVKEYTICNKSNKNTYAVDFEMPNSGRKDLFSVLWKTKKYDKISRIDSVTINIQTGEIFDEEDIFHSHSNNLMHELAKLSKGRLNMQITWKEFLEKIEDRDIQLYLKDGDWYIIFNESIMFDEIYEAKLPRYFIRYRQMHDK